MSEETNELIPEGTYRARAHSWDIGETSKGAEQLAISFALLTPGFEAKYMPYYGSFSEKALEITVKAMRACGWQGVDLSDLAGLDANEVTLVVEHETYEGTTRAKVKWVNSGSGALLKKVLDPAAKKSFAQRMRGAIAAVDTAGPKPRANGSASLRAPEPPPLSDNDAPNGMPF